MYEFTSILCKRWENIHIYTFISLNFRNQIVNLQVSDVNFGLYLLILKQFCNVKIIIKKINYNLETILLQLGVSGGKLKNGTFKNNWWNFNKFI